MPHAEIRGRNRAWKVWVPDAGQMAHTVPLYDEDGVLKEQMLVGSTVLGDKLRYVESYAAPFSSIEEATEYANYLGYAEVKVVKTKTKTEALAMARAARKEGNDATADAE